MSVDGIVVATVAAIAAALLFSHMSCKGGLMGACVFVYSLPTATRVRLLSPANLSITEPNHADDIGRYCVLCMCYQRSIVWSDPEFS